MYDKTFFYGQSEFFCGESLHPGWILCGKSGSDRDFHPKRRFFHVPAATKPSLWIFFTFFFCGIFGLRTRTCPTHPVENWRPLAFSTGLWRACPHFRQGGSCRKRGIFRKNCEKIGDFGELHKLFNSCLCKTHFFHTVFHNLWKSRGEIHRGCVETVGNPWEKTEFSTGGGVTRRGDTHQLPLISLIISSSSVRKTGF